MLLCTKASCTGCDSLQPLFVRLWPPIARKALQVPPGSCWPTAIYPVLKNDDGVDDDDDDDDDDDGDDDDDQHHHYHYHYCHYYSSIH